MQNAQGWRFALSMRRGYRLLQISRDSQVTGRGKDELVVGVPWRRELPTDTLRTGFPILFTREKLRECADNPVFQAFATNAAKSQLGKVDDSEGSRYQRRRRVVPRSIGTRWWETRSELKSITHSRTRGESGERAGRTKLVPHLFRRVFSPSERT